LEISGDHYSKALISGLDIEDDLQTRPQGMFWLREEFLAPPDL